MKKYSKFKKNSHKESFLSFFTDHKISSKNEKYKIHINNRKSETFTLKQMNEVVNINPQCLIKKNNN